MQHTDQDRIIALAGIHQAAHCVQRIANRGSVDTQKMEPCIYSLFQIDADDVPAVFGPPGAVAAGARQIVAQITGQPERDMELTRYVIALMRHERTLAGQPHMLAEVGRRIQGAANARGDLPLLDREVLAGLAGIYSDTISTLPQRIIVRGNPLYLQNADNQERIRALLLAGIRAAILWRQCGGRRLQMLLSRGKLLQSARDYLSAPLNDRA
ncbi:high frequency lysogenization protein HflD [Thiohalocapsa marina]|uniref:High frequency lysogenization protein HflD homolog n=1 Tax=Thiohalocapsa marina TaxID=424902 RepID=A0A5M8FQD2_9GAMM|nr:high frequency lysogenization protein HflD [Thiohalocapsa marina]KAA6186270.1 high frequency lysogenization protein HflD [Thiohalocapsa marina]